MRLVVIDRGVLQLFLLQYFFFFGSRCKRPQNAAVLLCPMLKVDCVFFNLNTYQCLF